MSFTVTIQPSGHTLVVDADESILDAALRQGLELTCRQLLKVAADNGMCVLNPVGEAFDPGFHQAISQGEAEGIAPGHVITVFQKGYTLNGRLLRPALVIVARHD